MPDAEQYFTVGLFSNIDVLLNRPKEELLAELPLTVEVKRAVLAQKGDMGITLQHVYDYENGKFELLKGLPLSSADYKQAYISAVDWTNAISAQISVD